MHELRVLPSRSKPDRTWLVELVDERTVRRTLIVSSTGEVLDDVWLDRAGDVRSWSKPSSAGHRPAPRAGQRESIGASGRAASGVPVRRHGPRRRSSDGPTILEAALAAAAA